MALAHTSGFPSPRRPMAHLIEPPQVRPGSQPGEWVVAAPPDVADDDLPLVFKGLEAQQRALTYAHERFGNVRFFPY